MIKRDEQWWLKRISGEPDCRITAGVPTERDVLWNIQQLAALGIEETDDAGPIANIFAAIHRVAASALASLSPPENDLASQLVEEAHRCDEDYQSTAAGLMRKAATALRARLLSSCGEG